MPTSPQEDLHNLLMTLFDESGLRRFVYFLKPELSRDLPSTGTSLSKLVFDTVVLLKRYRYLDEVFFERLRTEFSRSTAEIDCVAERHAVCVSSSSLGDAMRDRQDTQRDPERVRSDIETSISLYKEEFLARYPTFLHQGIAQRRTLHDRSDRLFAEPEITQTPDGRLESWKGCIPSGTHPATLLLGKIGMGKTTTLRWIARQFCLNQAGLPRCIPIWIDLRAVTYDSIVSVTAPTDFLRLSPLAAELLNDVMEELDQNRRVLLFVDGLDEVTDDTTRACIVSWIEDYASSPSPRWVVVSSRPEPKPYLSPFFRRWYLTAWSYESIKQQVHRYYHLLFPESDPETRTQDVFNVIAGNPALFELCQTPLFLSLVLAHGGRGPIPWPRHRLYEASLNFVLEEWDLPSNTKLGVPSIHPSDTRSLLGQIARSMLMNGELTISYEGALTLAQGLFSNEESAVSVLGGVCQRGSFLASSNKYLSFTHRAWMDFLGARQLVNSREVTPDLFSAHWSNPLWRHTLVIAVGLVADRNPIEVLPLLRAVLRARQTLDIEVLMPVVDFVTSALGSCVHIRREPINGFIEDFTSLLLAIELDNLWDYGLAGALMESGSLWPRAEKLREAIYTDRHALLALAVCSGDTRMSVLRESLAFESFPSAMVALLRMGRRLRPWTDKEIHDLLSIRSRVATKHMGPLMTESSYSLHIAAALLEDEPCQTASARLRMSLSDEDPEVRAYAALVLLSCGDGGDMELESFREAVGHKIWEEYVPAPIRQQLIRKARAVTAVLVGERRERVIEIMVQSKTRLLNLTDLDSKQGAVKATEPATDVPLDLTRVMLDFGEEDPLDDESIAARIRAGSLSEQGLYLGCLAASEVVAVTTWRNLAHEGLVTAKAQDEIEWQVVFATLLGDRDVLKILAEQADDPHTAQCAGHALSVAEALDRLIHTE